MMSQGSVVSIWIPTTATTTGAVNVVPVTTGQQ